ncbi:MAG: hypothetical protein Q9187_009240, partial [Circinaria calcarea]
MCKRILTGESACPEEGEVNGHSHKRDEPSDRSDYGSENGTNNPSTESEEEGNKCDSASNWVQNHNT